MAGAVTYATRTTTLFSLDSFKAWLKIEGPEPREDARLVRAADAGSEEIEQYLGVLFVTRAVSRTFNGQGKSALVLDHAPLVSLERMTGDVVNVRTFSDTVAKTNFNADTCYAPAPATTPGGFRFGRFPGQ